MKKINISYILFSRPWNQYAEENGITDLNTYLGNDLKLQQNDFLNYLASSILSIKDFFDLDNCSITIWILELDNASLLKTKESILEIIKESDIRNVEIHTIGLPVFEPLLTTMIESSITSNGTKKYSSSIVHELALYLIMQETKENYLLIIDADVLFEKTGFIDHCLQQLSADNNKVVCGFTEQKQLTPEIDIYLPRIQSFCLFVDLFRLKKILPKDISWNNLFATGSVFDMLKVKLFPDFLDQLENKDLYFDTLGGFSLYLEHYFSSSKIIPLEEKDIEYRVDPKNRLNVSCKYFMHGKIFS